MYNKAKAFMWITVTCSIQSIILLFVAYKAFLQMLNDYSLLFGILLMIYTYVDCVQQS